MRIKDKRTYLVSVTNYGSKNVGFRTINTEGKFVDVVNLGPEQTEFSKTVPIGLTTLVDSQEGGTPTFKVNGATVTGTRIDKYTGYSVNPHPSAGDIIEIDFT